MKPFPPGTAIYDQRDERAIHQAAGIPWYWLVDPANRTVTVLRLVSEGYLVDQVAGDSGSVALPPLGEVAIDLSSVFPPIE